MPSSGDIPPASNTSGMLFACWAIVIVLVLMFFVLMRGNQKEYARAIVPLGVLPAVHIFSALLANWIDRVLNLPITPNELRVAIDVTAGLISCLLMGLTSRHIAEKRTRNLFAWVCCGFLIILTLVLVFNIFASGRAEA